MRIGTTISSIYPDIIIDVDFTLTSDRTEIDKWITIKYTQPTQAELETAWIEVEKQMKPEVINTAFQSKIDNYLYKYPQAEIDRFTGKKIESQLVIDGGESHYITKKAEALGITALQYANAVHTKAEAYEEFYIECENERDLALNAL